MALATDAEGTVLFAGSLTGEVDLGGGARGAVDAPSMFVAKLDATGGHQLSIASTGAAEVMVTGAALSGDAVVVGHYAGAGFSLGEGTPLPAAQARDIFAFRIDSSGIVTSSKSFPSPDDQRALAVAIDPTDGSAVIVGAMAGTVDFETEVLASSGQGDMFVVKLDSAGTVLWANRYGGGAEAEQVASAVAIDDDGSIYVAGVFDGSIDFAGSMDSVSGSNVFIGSSRPTVRSPPPSASAIKVPFTTSPVWPSAAATWPWLALSSG